MLKHSGASRHSLTVKMATVIKNYIKVRTLSLGNSSKSQKTLFTFSAPYELSRKLRKYCTIALNHSVH